MTRSSIRPLLPGLAALALAGGAYAGTYTVSKNPADSADFDTVTAAILAADADGQPTDTITILDSSTYAENFPFLTGASNGGTLNNIDNLTLVAAAGQTPVLDKTSGGGQAIRWNPESGTGTLVIGGASPTSKMTIRNSANANPVLNTGAGTTRANRVLASNLVIDRPLAFTGFQANLNNQGAHVFTNVDFRGRSYATAEPVINIAQGNGTTATFTNCSFEANGSGYIFQLQALAPDNVSGDIVLDDCVIMPSQDSVDNGAQMAPFASLPGYAGTVTVNDCTLGHRGATLGGPRGILVAQGAETWNLNRPTFVGNGGDIAFWVPAAAEGPTINITGAPGSPVDLSPLVLGGSVLFARFCDGSLNLQHVTSTSGWPAGFVDSAFEGSPSAATSMTLRDAVLQDNHPINLIHTDATPNPAFADFAVSLLMERVTWTGANASPAWVTTTNELRSVPATVTINDSDISVPSTAPNPRMTNMQAGDVLTVFNSTLDGGEGDNPAIAMNLVVDHEATFTDCVVSDMFGAIAPGPNADITFDDCTLARVGDILFRNMDGGTLTFRNMTLDSGVARILPFSRLMQGTVNFENAVLDGFVINNDDGDPNNGATDGFTLAGDGITVNFDRCDVRATTFVPLELATNDAPAYAGGATIVNATNTIFRGAPALGQLINVDSQLADAAPSAINLLHCTFHGGTANIYIGTDSDGRDSINTDYTIYALQGAADVNGTSVPSGTGNLIFPAGCCQFTPGAPNLTGSIFADPVLDSTGRLQVGSAAINAATDSTTIVDVDGTARPFGIAPDIGAHELNNPANVTNWDWLVY